MAKAYSGAALDLAESLDIPVDKFLNTVEEYNDMCDAGWDELFEKDRRYLYPMEKGPFYALEFYAGAYGTLGGIKINPNTEVISTEGEVIPGLFAAGETTGGVHGGNRIGGNAVCDFVVFGRIAGANAAEYAGAEELAPAA